MSKYLPKSPLWRRTAVAAAAGLLLATGAAYAQSNATGTIYGKVESGSTVLIENKGTGLKRTLTPDANGRFNATALPTGVYKATLMRNGAVAGSQDGIEVLLGQGAEVAFGASTSLQSVQVVGQRKRIDV
ncbi:MAG TPA: carboxypeptidase-like regulatory domain-containing protein, partial [Rhodoferax sp.]|nr:carboxypeptidase-like regulatory domain-containing protein [Rhodoferax sp.]